MALEDYFDFLDPLDIRIKGHRIGIDDVLHYYLKGYAPSAIRDHYPSLSLEEIEAVIAYYHAHPAEVEKYLHDLSSWHEELHQQLVADPPPVAQRIRVALEAKR